MGSKYDISYVSGCLYNAFYILESEIEITKTVFNNEKCQVNIILTFCK